MLSDDSSSESGKEGGIEKARERVKELKECVQVWKGTSEEKARAKWVGEVEAWVEESIAKFVAAKEGMNAGKEGWQREGRGGKGVGGDGGRGRVNGVETPPARTGSGAGFLRRLRDEIYMD